MKQVLFVNGCVRAESRTKRLAETLLAQLDGEVQELVLETEGIRPLNRQRLEERNRYIEEGQKEAPMLQYEIGRAHV